MAELFMGALYKEGALKKPISLNGTSRSCTYRKTGAGRKRIMAGKKQISRCFGFFDNWQTKNP